MNPRLASATSIFTIAAVLAACSPLRSRQSSASDGVALPADTAIHTYVLAGDSAAALSVVRELWHAHLASDSISVRRASLGGQPLAHLSASWPVRNPERQRPETLQLVWLARFSPESDTVRAYFSIPTRACAGSRRRAAIGFLLRPSLHWRVERVIPLTEC
jgi:hypothetical protein